MDSNRFGVTLKSTGLGDKKERERKKYTPARKNQFSNMKDIKNMFESGVGDKSEDVRVPSNFGTDYKERKFTTQRSITKSESNKTDSKHEEDLALFSQIKFNIDVNKNTSLERTNSSGSVSSPRSSRKGTRDLEATTNGSPRASRRTANEDDCTAEPCVVKAKVMSGGSYQASVDNKLQRVNSQEDKIIQVDKKMATSALIGNLSILRTRPGSGGKKSDSSMSTNNDSFKSNGIFNTSSNLQKDPWKKSNSSSDSVSSSKDLPWLKSSSDSKESSSNITNYGSRDSSATKEIKDRKSKDLNSSSSPKSVDKSGAPFDFSLSYTKKPDDSVSSGSVYSRQSSVESMASEKSSPRSSLKRSNKLQLDHSNVSDTTSSGSLSPRVRQFSPESKPDDKPEWMDKSKELVNKFQTKLKKPVISDFSVIVTSSSASSNSSKTSISSSTTKTTSTWTPKSTSPAESKTSSTFSKTTTQKSSTGQSEEALKDREPFVKSVSGSREPKLSSETDGKVDIKEKQYLSRKISSETFQKLKGGFEQTDDNTSKLSGQHKPKIDIKVTKNFIERKNSFEKLDTQVSMTKSKTLKNLQAEGKMLGIKERINALNEGKGEIPDQKSKQKSQFQRSEEVTAPHEEYNDIEGFEVYKTERSNDWPSDFSDSDGDNMYEYIPATDPEKQEDNLVCSLRRKPGQKSTSSIRKGNNRPSFDKDLTLDSSPEVTTEGSSRDGTLESTEDGTGIEADVEEYDSDGSGSSGVYEPIDPDWQDHLKSSPDPASQGDTPPDLPPGRNRHKKKKEGGKTIGKKFKKLKEKLASNPDKQKDEGIPKVSSTSSLASNSSSSGLLKKMGKMMKKPKQGANQEKFVEDSEELGICHSDSSDMNDNVYEDEPIQMHKVPSEEDNSGSDIYEQHMDRDFDDEPEKSPIPPRPSLPPPAPPPAPPVPPRLSLPPMSNKDEPPPRPPSTGRSPISKENNNMPALPPRNRISTSFNLDTVVPISPGLSGPTWHPSQDSYLHGHRVKGSDFHDHRDRSGSSSSSDEANQGMVRANAQDYLEPDPPVKGRSMIVRDNSVPEEPAPPIPPPPVIRHREKELLDKRPSSGYASFKPYQSMNAVTAPFDDLLNYKSQLEFDSSGEDQLYFDLSDDQLYGTLDRRFTSKFTSEPLYQCYHRDKVTRSSARHTEMTLSDDEEEEIPISKPDRGERIYEAVEDIELDDDKPKSKLSTLDMFGKSGSVLRALWCEMPEVKESGILDKVSPQERKIQEAMFEIITSEASYLKSLNVLINVFLMSPEFSEESELSDRCVITRQERHVLFSNIGAVRETSEKFLCDLEARWQKSVFLSDICDIIYQHAANKFECYVRYCTNQTFQERAVQELQKRPEICEIIKKLERTPECQGLPMISFLLLPMQRITRLPLLVDAICHRLEPNTDKHKSACRAMDALSRVVKKCNDGAKKMQQTEQMCHLVRNLEFKVKEIPLISASRFLVKQGELTRIMTESSSRLPFGKRNSSKQPIYVFLFNDMLVVSKRKNNNTYVVTDYAKRNTLHVENIDSPEKSKLLPNGVPSGCKNLFMVVLLENHEQRQVEMIFSCKSPSDRTRWIDALSPTNKESDNEKIYEEWDCPQVQCLQRYHATEPDELTIEESDVINVFKKMGDGWYEGERIRDGEKGWFPSTCVEEIVNSHVRSRNLRLRYRLMLASQDYGDLSLRAGLNKA